MITRKNEVRMVNHLLLGGAFSPQVSLLGNGKFGTLALGKRYPRLITLTDDEDIGNTRWKKK